ncbi:Uu.00g093210.m01.CDS01 [Anthostomella pinea]|uniref:Uu.00g093210.m01.CDS01 n=1 Tax=Anthostomella pinea TaxID=933095 RepID=A0AAI8VNF5_9PEZI|nr:Uu.00g093210.m01.CDS01 [Anthostomella pinea]
MATSRPNSVWSSSKGNMTDIDTPTAVTPDAQSEVLTTQHAEKGNEKLGRVVGGRFIQINQESNLHQDHGLLKTIDDTDVPLTLTEMVHKDGQDYIVLHFAEGDCENPFNWPAGKKIFVCAMLNMMTLFIGLATTAYSSGIGSMTTEFGVPQLYGQLGLFTFNAACAIAPLFLAPFCELVGRKIVYAGGYLCFTLLFIGLALGRNIETIVILRLLLGLCGCVGTILVGGTFDDMYEPHLRGPPMAMFTYVAILGTVGAPIYAGFIDETIGWRWIEGIQGLANIPLLLCVFIFFPETRGGARLHKRAKQLKKATGDDRYAGPDDLDTKSPKDMLKVSSVKAIRMLATEPVVLAFGLWIGFAWFVTFLFLSAIPITFQEKRGWSEGVAGLPYIGLCIGTTIGWAAHHLQMRKYNQIENSDVKATPEHRLYGAMFGAVWLPIGLFIYSFTQYAFVHWIGPCIGLVLIAVGIFFVFEATYSYTADCYGQSASSAIAGQGLVRNMLGAVSPLFASAFFHNLGSQYAGLLLALVATGLSMIAFVMFKFGPQLRARSKRALVY